MSVVRRPSMRSRYAIDQRNVESEMARIPIALHDQFGLGDGRLGASSVVVTIRDGRVHPSLQKSDIPKPQRQGLCTVVK